MKQCMLLLVILIIIITQTTIGGKTKIYVFQLSTFPLLWSHLQYSEKYWSFSRLLFCIWRFNVCSIIKSTYSSYCVFHYSLNIPYQGIKDYNLSKNFYEKRRKIIGNRIIRRNVLLTTDKYDWEPHFTNSFNHAGWAITLEWIELEFLEEIPCTLLNFRMDALIIIKQC